MMRERDRDGRREPDFIDGNIEIRAGFFPIERARNLDTWHVTGMRATGSNDYEFADVMVGDDWTFAPLRPAPPAPGDDVFQLDPAVVADR